MPVFHYFRNRLAPDQGNLASNPDWLTVLNVVPYGERWLADPFFANRLDLSPDTDIRGFHIHAQNGTNGWKIYFGTDTKLGEVEPATWTKTIHNTGFSNLDSEVGWQLVGYGPHEIAVGGLQITPQIRTSDSGTFGTLITNAEPVPPGGAATGNWPPKAKFVTVWGDSVVIANLTDVGPANAFGNTCGHLWWISKAQDAQTFGIISSNPGDGTTYDYLSDDQGDITALAGGSLFGAVFKARATYRVEYFAGDAIVAIDRLAGGLGTIFPNSVVVAEDEIYFMSLAGPAVLRRSGPPETLGKGAIQRSLFDATWVVDTFPLNTDQSSAYLCYGAYHPLQDVVSWYYRNTNDEMDMVIHYHRATGRFALGQRGAMVTAGASRVLAAGITPRLEATRWSGAQGLLFIDKNGILWEANPTAGDRWSAKPKFRTPRMLLARNAENVPVRIMPRNVLPHYSLNAGASDAPQYSITVNQYATPSTNTTIATETVSAEGEEGLYEFSALKEAVWVDVEIEIGNATLQYLENLAVVLDGFELDYTRGGDIA